MNPSDGAAAELTLGHFPARWWRARADGRLECLLCPRNCKLAPDQHGFCHVRRRTGSQIEVAGYGRTAGFQVDPIEKKPLFHFLPGTSALSFGTVGCNLGCRFCQNWHVSRATTLAPLHSAAQPAEVPAMARALGCRSVAFTYNDPVVFAEYAIDVARACRAQGVAALAITAGYISAAPRTEFFAAMDATNIDLKAFSDEFYCRLCYGRLQPVLDTLCYVRRETSVWLEVTTLLIPGQNDRPEEIDRASDWFAAELGPQTPWHFTAYHPDFQLTAPPTPLETLLRAREIARSKGLRHVYAGNSRAGGATNTCCPRCGSPLIERDGFAVTRYLLEGNRCPGCGERIAGVFAAAHPPTGEG